MRPAEMMVGRVLGGGWTVTAVAPRPKAGTGGHFSRGYIVKNKDGRDGFLKAMDYVEAFKAPDTAKLLEAMMNCFIHSGTNQS